MTPGYQALADSAAILDLSDRGRIRVTGEDRARLLHAMTTNHVQDLKPGGGQYTFFLNAQGQIQADAYVLCFADHFLLDVEPQTRHSVYEHLDRFIIADDVTLEDVTEQTFCLSLEGPQAVRLAGEIGISAPNPAFAHSEWEAFSVAAISFSGATGVRVYGAGLRKDDARIVDLIGGPARDRTNDLFRGCGFLTECRLHVPNICSRAFRRVRRRGDSKRGREALRKQKEARAWRAR